MEITDKKVVSLIYELRQDSATGAVVEQVDKANPLTFLFGSGNLLPKFEEHLSKLKTGDAFEFGLNSEDAYGPVVDNAVVSVPKNIFEVEGKIDENMLQVGNMVPMMDNEGRRLNGKVLEITDEVVKMDFNHPMAGENLHFKGEVTEIREATDEELTHGHVHGNQDCGSCDDKPEGDASCSCGH
jgi:FKBP-type peptidyl-prolyl cis-trans isomerase SlyD